MGERDLAGSGARYVRPDDVVWIVNGDLGKVESGIRELGYGDIVRLDPDGKPIG